MTQIKFKVVGERATTFDKEISYRVTCERLDNKEIFYCRSAVSTEGKYTGGIVSEIKKKGETITIDLADGTKKDFVLRRDTGIEVTFSNIATQKAGNEYASFVTAL